MDRQRAVLRHRGGESVHALGGGVDQVAIGPEAPIDRDVHIRRDPGFGDGGGDEADFAGGEPEGLSRLLAVTGAKRLRALGFPMAGENGVQVEGRPARDEGVKAIDGFKPDVDLVVGEAFFLHLRDRRADGRSAAGALVLNQAEPPNAKLRFRPGGQAGKAQLRPRKRQFLAPVIMQRAPNA